MNTTTINQRITEADFEQLIALTRAFSPENLNQRNGALDALLDGARPFRRQDHNDAKMATSLVKAWVESTGFPLRENQLKLSVNAAGAIEIHILHEEFATPELYAAYFELSEKFEEISIRKVTLNLTIADTTGHNTEVILESYSDEKQANVYIYFEGALDSRFFGKAPQSEAQKVMNAAISRAKNE